MQDQIDQYLVAFVALFVACHALVLAVGGLAKLVALWWPPAQVVVDVCAKLSTDIGWVLGLLARHKPPEILALLLALTALCSSGCTGTFEEARLAVPVAQSAPRRCQTLSDRQSVFGALGVVSASLAAPTGLIAIPVESDIARSVLIGSAVVLSAGAAGAALVSDDAGKEYLREGCAKE